MFHFARLPPHVYVFNVRYRRITSGGLPHSEIHGSMAVQRLTVAYRSLQRPSSAPGAKASTVCPYYLDGICEPSRLAWLGDCILIGTYRCAVLKVREMGPPIGAPLPSRLWAFGPMTRRARGTDECRSLKAQQRARHGRPHEAARRVDSSPVDIPRRRSLEEIARIQRMLPRKEVIQPHLPVRLPCYDFTPVTGPTFDGSLPKGVRPPASGVAHFRGVTGGVYKARERIHRGIADPRLLATPPSCRRVSACNPN
jgi:hypothetical protein